ncbi:MAG: winged helix-turn-helix transcriptional regulator [Prevotellaceae bacterium]|jgi:hypothetical protein|nr:winged helix-turn-helix transcriptional regulator [Prevotellaceae bacterium]
MHGCSLVRAVNTGTRFFYCYFSPDGEFTKLPRAKFNIRTIWQEEGWQAPVWEETFAPERLKLSVPVELEERGAAEDTKKPYEREKDSERVGEKVGEKRVGDEKVGEKVGEKLTDNQQKIMDSIAQNPCMAATELSLAVGISKRKVEINIAKLKAKGVLERIGPDRGGYWKVKP